MKKVLFVCSGNVFRSLTAMECLEDYIKKERIKGISVDSAGIHTPMLGINPITRADLKKEGIVFRYTPKKITPALVKNSNLIISMGLNHQKFLKDKYDVDSILFNKLAYGRNTGVLDIEENMPALAELPREKRIKTKSYKKVVNDTILHIYNGTPRLAARVIRLLG